MPIVLIVTSRFPVLHLGTSRGRLTVIHQTHRSVLLKFAERAFFS
jgi:hypothetical protein